MSGSWSSSGVGARGPAMHRRLTSPGVGLVARGALALSGLLTAAPLHASTPVIEDHGGQFSLQVGPSWDGQSASTPLSKTTLQANVRVSGSGFWLEGGGGQGLGRLGFLGVGVQSSQETWLNLEVGSIVEVREGGRIALGGFGGLVASPRLGASSTRRLRLSLESGYALNRLSPAPDDVLILEGGLGLDATTRHTVEIRHVERVSWGTRHWSSHTLLLNLVYHWSRKGKAP